MKDILCNVTEHIT